MDTAEQKKIKSNIKRRETNYRAYGYKIILGSDAFEMVKNPQTNALLAVDTDYWTSIEFIETNQINDEFVDVYLYRFLSDGNILKKICLSNDKSFTDFVCRTKWAVRKSGRQTITYEPNDR
jgi:hypothetical protein